MKNIDKEPVKLLVIPISQNYDKFSIKIIMDYSKHDKIQIPYNGLDLIDSIQAVNSNAKDVGVVVLCNRGMGLYDLTIKKNTTKIPVRLDNGEYLEFKISISNDNEITYESQVVRFEQKLKPCKSNV